MHACVSRTTEADISLEVSTPTSIAACSSMRVTKLCTRIRMQFSAGSLGDQRGTPSFSPALIPSTPACSLERFSDLKKKKKRIAKASATRVHGLGRPSRCPGMIRSKLRVRCHSMPLGLVPENLVLVPEHHRLCGVRAACQCLAYFTRSVRNVIPRLSYFDSHMSFVTICRTNRETR